MSPIIATTRRRTLTALAGATALALAPGAVRAGSLDSYRAQGVIAERYDGLVELRTRDAPAEAKRIVERVNAKRRQIYEKRAENQGVSVKAVGKVYAEQIWKDAPPGTYLKEPGGGYVRK